MLINNYIIEKTELLTKNIINITNIEQDRQKSLCSKFTPARLLTLDAISNLLLSCVSLVTIVLHFEDTVTLTELITLETLSA